MAYGPKPKDLTDTEINGITFLSFSHRAPGRHGSRLWSCRCFCGAVFVARPSQVRSGHTRSCGCLLREFLATGRARRTHGKRKSAEYSAWAKMIQRCTNPKDPKYIDYGGRGITVCERWRNSFENFLADMGDRPAQGLSIHRKKNDAGYEPDNCCWASAKTQAAPGNRRAPKPRPSHPNSLKNLRPMTSESAKRAWQTRRVRQQEKEA